MEHQPECFCEVCRGDELPTIPEKKVSTIRERISKCKEEAVLIRVTQRLLPSGELIEEKQFVRNLPAKYSEFLTFLGYESDRPKFLAMSDDNMPLLEHFLAQKLPRKPKGLIS
ncbi:hypothetical protein ACYFX5_07820 [Bremerella sp. T1]|uniref:hypothetical protein n=1 Tax=Bremerella sp. TYQ1 TaxID=3119568 RepID=UPI001CCE2E50|nr:hypothetical protein [Bremerella volcania]UBM38164.1 hypothetical protein LA756_09755 [Bremerella volcania]